jgi:hypothetical protein
VPPVDPEQMTGANDAVLDVSDASLDELASVDDADLNVLNAPSSVVGPVGVAPDELAIVFEPVAAAPDDDGSNCIIGSILSEVAATMGIKGLAGGGGAT